ncbi:unnamed protein product [Tetraodon nigroviridis]|uniref:Galectin n=1 Tax=Tetraodon nigroviridis TaxID=99883 RepID=Q4TC58_TETNG|nr:unnamed protein product [Tetraodon nigroviridis]
MSQTKPRQTFLNLTLPFAGTILGGLRPGEMVLIQGRVPQEPDRFQVDFSCGSSVQPRADVAFHFNPRFGRSPCVVCNTLQKQRWGREEVSPCNPFTAGSTFEIIVLVQRDSFKVAVDGMHLLQYNHRVALQQVNTLGISGSVQVSAVGVLPGASSAEDGAGHQQPETQVPGGWPSAELVSPGAASRAGLRGGLSVGSSITVTGRPTHNADRFCVNLRNANSSDIALHLNPRLKKRVFVRNSFLRQSWGPEETAAAAFPFTAGRYFEVIILCERRQFRVAVDGVHQLDYKHRVPDLEQITQVEVLGDVQLLSVTSTNL